MGRLLRESGVPVIELRASIVIGSGSLSFEMIRALVEHLPVEDAVDCWRVTAFEPDRLLRLEAERRLPGRAWLEFEVTPDGAGSRIRQMAVFEPSGLAGLAYWYGVYALHAIVFGSMLRAIARDAVGASRIEAGAPGARDSPCSCSRPDSRPRAHRAAACLRRLRAGSD